MNSQRHNPQGGPPLGVLAVVFTALFVAGLALSAIVGGGAVFPSPFGPEADSFAYFSSHRSAVQVSAFFQFACAFPLAIYTATVHARLHRLGIRAPGATIALAGGLLASAFMALSGLLCWVLSRPGISDEPVLVRVLHHLAFGAGGVGHVVPLGLLIAGIAVPGLLAGLLPKWWSVAGLVIAGLAQLATLTLLLEGAGYLLPIARFTGLIWLIVAGFRLPLSRDRAGRTP
ncbi:DUF4386 domain-containing protein [Allokutzneria sp. NRRL B-24872]|uniref:DUF4386 domain-containing protein n=1 Tax=Allokutzneria sp. NRRL B-24872 TaxID=1137961 RepID=UPI001AEFCFF9|nr:DUF4386 domain-containing protein [Allokutzneria sp. NRRL B-24872]